MTEKKQEKGGGAADGDRQVVEADEAELRTRVGDLEALLDVAPVGIAFADTADCKEIVVNRYGARILGTPRIMPPSGDDAPYRLLHEGRVVASEDLPLQKVWRTGKAVRGFRATYVHDNGTRFELLMTAAPVFDADGRIRRVIGVYDDITRLIRAQADAERRARQHDYLASLGTRSLQGERVESLLETLPGEIAGVLSADFVKVLEYRPATHDFLLQAAFGFDLEGARRVIVPSGNRSQAGVALESGQPIIVEDLRSDPRFSGPELLERHGVRSGLSVAIGDSGWPLGVLGVHSREVRSFDEHDVRFLQAVANVLAATIQRDETERHQDVLLAELQHRVKNSLATVQAIASLSFRNTPHIDADLAVFRDRIGALSAAHDVLFRTGWRAVELAEVVRSQLDRFTGPTERIGVTVSREPITLSSNTAMEMSMVLHELATNAVRHGALSNETGRVDVSWRLELDDRPADRTGAMGERLVFEWRESGGPKVSQPQSRGIGTTLVSSAFHGLDDASVALDYRAEGLVCRIAVSLGAIEGEAVRPVVPFRVRRFRRPVP